MADKGEMWIVGRRFWTKESNCRVVRNFDTLSFILSDWTFTWDLHGVFHKREDAEALCKDHHWFIAPIMIDEPLPDMPCELAGLVFPNKAEGDLLQHEPCTRK